PRQGGERHSDARHDEHRGAGNRPARGDGGNSHFEDQQPRANAHLGTQMGRPLTPRAPAGGGGQPDPMRTSVDSMTERGRRGGGFRSGGGGGGGGFGGGRGGGGGFGGGRSGGGGGGGGRGGR